MINKSTPLPYDNIIINISGKADMKLTPDELRLAVNYANLHSISLIEAFKSALFEKIEDEYDEALATEAWEAYQSSGEQARPIQELWDELGI